MPLAMADPRGGRGGTEGGHFGRAPARGVIAVIPQEKRRIGVAALPVGQFGEPLAPIVVGIVQGEVTAAGAAEKLVRVANAVWPNQGRIRQRPGQEHRGEPT